jgi:hypothetical protein
MRRATFILISVLIAVNSNATPKETKSNTKPDAGGVMIDPSEGEIAAGAELTITFPNAMVGADKIDMSGQPSPFMKATFCGRAKPKGCSRSKPWSPARHIV